MEAAPLRLGGLKRIEEERACRQRPESKEERARLVGQRKKGAADRMDEEKQNDRGGERSGQHEIAAVGDRSGRRICERAEGDLLETCDRALRMPKLGEKPDWGQEPGYRAVAEVVDDRLLVEEPARRQIDEAERGKPQPQREEDREDAKENEPAHGAASLRG